MLERSNALRIARFSICSIAESARGASSSCVPLAAVLPLRLAPEAWPWESCLNSPCPCKFPTKNVDCSSIGNRSKDNSVSRQRMTIRWMTFSNCRILPGQSYSINASMVSAERLEIDLPTRRAVFLSNPNARASINI